MKSATTCLFIIFLFTSVFLCVNINIAEAKNNPTTIYFFWSDGCPHCADEKKHLDFLVANNPDLTVKDWDISTSDIGQEILTQMSNAYGAKTTGVPITFIGENVVYGAQLDKITERVEECINNSCIDPADKIGINVEQNTNNQENKDEGNQYFTIVLIIAIGLLAISTIFILFSKK